MHSNPNTTPRLPNSQEWLIKRMQTLGYPSNNEGVCFGITHMGMQAILADDFDNFYRRLQLINSIPVEEFKNKIDELNKKRLDLITQEKEHAIESFNHRRENIKTFENSDYFQKKLAELNATFAKLANENIMLDEIEKERRKADLLRNAYIQFHIDEALTKLSNDERLLLEIPAFFEGIELYFNPKKYPDLLPHGKFQNAMKSMPITQSKIIEEQKNIVKLTEFTGVYDVMTLTAYLNSLHESILTTPPPLNNSFVLTLNNYDHSILIKYNPTKNNKWSILDPNYLQNSKLPLPPEKAASYAIKMLSNNNITTFSTKLYALKSDEKQFNDIINKWHQNPHWQAIHTPTYHNAQLADSYNATWLYTAARNNDLITVNKILSLGVNPNVVTKKLKTPLYVAILRGNLEVTKSLLKAGADLNISNNAGLTPLRNALIDKNLSLIKLFLSFGAKADLPAPHDGVSPFFIAVCAEQQEIIKLMLTKDIDVDKSYSVRIDQLMQLAKEANVENTMTSFIQKNKDRDGRIDITASQIATMLKMNETVYLINQHKAEKKNFLSAQLTQQINEEIARIADKDVPYKNALLSLRNAMVHPDNELEFIGDIINNIPSNKSNAQATLFTQPNAAPYPFIEHLKEHYSKSFPSEPLHLTQVKRSK